MGVSVFDRGRSTLAVIVGGGATLATNSECGARIDVRGPECHCGSLHRVRRGPGSGGWQGVGLGPVDQGPSEGGDGCTEE